MTVPATDTPAVADAADPYRRRLLDGLADSIAERGYRASTVAEIVRAARTSKRTFYDHFASKEECLLELLRVDNEELALRIRTAVDPQADWQVQIRQAVEAYVAQIRSRPAITLSWIRDMPSLGEVARPAQRRGLELMSNLLIELSGSPGFRRANLPPLSPALAVILLGGLRELTALAVEDGDDIGVITEPAIVASIALLGPRS